MTTKKKVTKKKPAKKKSGGQSKWDDNLIQKIKDWMEDYPTTVTYKDKITNKKTGDVTHVDRVVPNDPPFMSDLAKFLKISRDTLYRWQKEHDDLSDTIKGLFKTKTEELLIKNTLQGRYNAPFAIFMAKNAIGWKDKQEISGDQNSPFVIKLESTDKDI